MTTKQSGRARPRLETLEERDLPQASGLQVVFPGTVYSGPTYALTLQAVDNTGQVDPTYAGTVHFTSSDPAAALPADYTFTAADQGVHAFLKYLPIDPTTGLVTPGVVTLPTTGTQTVTATDTANATVTGSAGVNVLEESDPPQVGGVTDTAARILTRTNVATGVAIEYSTDPGLAGSATTDAVATTSDTDFTAILPLTGLVPATQYYYRVLADGVPQQTAPYPSFTTFPTPGTAADFSVGVISDTATALDYPYQTAPAYAQIAAENPALVLQIGDFDHRNPLSLPQFYAMDRQMRGPYDAAGRDWAASIAPNFPVDHVYDDHDSGTNNADKNSPTRLMAMQSYQLYYPTYDLVNPSEGIYHSFTYGQAQFFMLDTRDERDPDATPDGPGKSMLGADQLAWLENGLSTSPARWKVIVTTVALNQTSTSDGWSAFRTEWASLVNFIRQNQVQGVFALSADLHSEGAIDNGTNSGVPEMSVPYNNLLGGRPLNVVGKGWTQGVLVGKNQGGYSTVQFLTHPDRVVLYAKAQDGTVRFKYQVPLVAGSPHFVISRQSWATAGSSLSVTVTAVDGAGNVLTDYQGTVHFTSNDALAVPPADYTFTTADAGVHTFPLTLIRAGTGTTFTVEDTADAAMTDVIQQTVVAGPATHLFGKAAVVTAGVAFVEQVQALDAYGNVATGYTGTVHFLSSDHAAVLPAKYTFTSGTFGTYDNGAHAFTLTLNTTGVQKVQVKDKLVQSIHATIKVTVNAPAPPAAVGGGPADDFFASLGDGDSGPFPALVARRRRRGRGIG